MDTTKQDKFRAKYSKEFWDEFHEAFDEYEANFLDYLIQKKISEKYYNLGFQLGFEQARYPEVQILRKEILDLKDQGKNIDETRELLENKIDVEKDVFERHLCNIFEIYNI